MPKKLILFKNEQQRCVISLGTGRFYLVCGGCLPAVVALFHGRTQA